MSSSCNLGVPTGTQPGSTGAHPHLHSVSFDDLSSRRQAAHLLGVRTWAGHLNLTLLEFFLICQRVIIMLSTFVGALKWSNKIILIKHKA